MYINLIYIMHFYKKYFKKIFIEFIQDFSKLIHTWFIKTNACHIIIKNNLLICINKMLIKFKYFPAFSPNRIFPYR